MRLLFTLVLCLGVFQAAPAHSAPEMVDRVVAVVNSDIITFQDVHNRLMFTARNLQHQLNDEQQQALLHDVLDQLINEQLIIQYAKKHHYAVSQKELDDEIARIEKNNNQPPGSFLEFAGAQKDSALQQVRVNLLRQKIVNQEIAPQISVGGEEIQRLLDSMLSHAETNERKIAQIFIPVGDGGSSADKAKKTIDDLYANLQKGAAFSEVARTYSKDSSATDGGTLGWFNPGELAPNFEQAINKLKVGEITPPVQSSNGWHIFKLLDMRSASNENLKPIKQMKLIQLYAALDSVSGTPARVQNDKLAPLFKKAAKKDSAGSFLEFAKEQAAKPQFGASGELGWVTLSNMPDPLHQALDKTEPGHLSPVVATNNGTYLFFVEDARDVPSPLMDQYRDRLRQRLTDTRAAQMMRRLVRDLRREAYINITL